MERARRGLALPELFLGLLAIAVAVVLTSHAIADTIRDRQHVNDTLSVPGPPSVPALWFNVPPLITQVRPDAIVTVPELLRVEGDPLWFSVRSPPLMSSVPLFWCAELARLMVSGWLTVTRP